MPTHQHSLRSLPVKASDEYLRKEAKRVSKLRGINLVAAQRALAHEYGYRNWAELTTAAKPTLQLAHRSGSLATRPPEPGEAPDFNDEEWSAVRSLAEVSLSEMPAAADVKEWLENRKSFLESGGVQQNFVATLGKQIVGYGCVEHPPAWMRNKKDAAGEYRLFVVIEPAARRTLGTRLLAKLGESLVGLGARRAWFQEYEADSGFISFLEEKGFVESASFQIEDGTRIVRLSMDAPFEPLMQQALRPNPGTYLPDEEERR